MKPYGVKIEDRRKVFDDTPDKYNTRGCFNRCGCSRCRSEKTKRRKNTVRTQVTSLNVKNGMRSAKKKARQCGKKEIKKSIE